MAITLILFNANVANAPSAEDVIYGRTIKGDNGSGMIIDAGFVIVATPIFKGLNSIIVGPAVRYIEKTFNKIFTGTSELPTRLARVIPGSADDVVRLGKKDATDVFVTNADDIAGITSSQEIAERLTLIEKNGALRQGPFKIIEFDNPMQGLGQPVFRNDPGFVGKGFTKGGASEYIVPNYKISELKNVTVRTTK